MSRALAGNLALAFSSVLATLGLAEAAVRLTGFGEERGRATACVFTPGRTVLLDCYPANPRGSFDVDLRDPATLARYAALGVRRVEAAAARAPFCVEFRYNSARYRGPEIPARRPGILRVIALGDSFTEGQGVREDQVWPRVLGAGLDVARPGRYEVINAGRRASDFPDLRGAFDEVLQFQPDVVVYAMVPNDAQRGPGLLAPAADLITGGGAGALHFDRLGFLEPRILTVARHRLAATRLTAATVRWYRDLHGPANAQGWAATRSHLAGMGQEARRRGFRLVVALWPLLVGPREQRELEPVYEAMTAAVREAGLPLHDLRPALAGRDARDLWVHPVDMHPNEDAHRLAGESLVAFVQREAR
jgi:lysophospholipase L1-like esterase